MPSSAYSSLYLIMLKVIFYNIKHMQGVVLKYPRYQLNGGGASPLFVLLSLRAAPPLHM